MDWPGRIRILEDIARAQARALADLNARLLRAEQNVQQGGGRSRPGGGGAVEMLARGKAWNDIDPGTLTTPGTGQVTLYVQDGGSWVPAPGDPVTVYNQFQDTYLNTGAEVQLAKIAGKWWIINPASVSMLAFTFEETTYPDRYDRYFACYPATIDGALAEYAAVGINQDFYRTVYAACLGPRYPGEGARVMLHWVGDRWAFQWFGTNNGTS